MKKNRKTRMLAGVFAALLVLQASSISAFAEETTAAADITTAPLAQDADFETLPAPADSYTVPTEAVEDKIVISGAFTMPDQISQGKNVEIIGAVSSAVSALTSLTVGVYSSAGGFMTGTTINPNSDWYDISKLDSKVDFASLTPGVYNFAILASNASKTNVTLMLKQFEVRANAADPGMDSIGITGSTEIPAEIKAGQAVSVNGILTSAYSNLTSVSVVIDNEFQTRVTGATATPNALTYDISRLDSKIAFNKLAAGKYFYRIYATNGSNTNELILESTFNVTADSTAPAAANDTLTAANIMTIPPTLRIGTPLNVQGTVTSALSDITSLTCGVYDTNGKFVTGRTINPNSRSYDLKRLDAYVAFNSLPVGNYIYAVIASNASSSNYTLVRKSFTVSDSTSSYSGSGVNITGGTTVPSLLTRGKGVAVRGTVSSSSLITSVTVAVNNKNAQTGTETSATAAPNAYSYNLSALDSQVRFDLLPAGTYEYIVVVTVQEPTTKRNYVVTSQTFVVQ